MRRISSDQMLDTPLIAQGLVDPYTETGCVKGLWTLSDIMWFISPIFFILLAAFGMQLSLSSNQESLIDSQYFAFWVQLLTFGWWYVINVYVWRVNEPAVGYAEVLQYENDPAPRTPMQLMKIVGLCTYVVFIAVLVYALLGNQSAVILNWLIWVLALGVLMGPKGVIPQSHWRWDFVKNVKECWYSAMYLVDVRFQLTWVTDMWTSACLTLWHLEYAFCSSAVIVSGIFSGIPSQDLGAWNLYGDEKCGSGSSNEQVMKPVMYLIPFVLRFFQEIRTKNWWNVGKYFSCIMMIVSSTMHDQQHHLGGLSVDDEATQYSWGFWYGFWIFWAVTKTCYCYAWDLIRDWGLLQDDQYLRSQKLYANNWVYYFAMFTNFCGRVSWTLALSPHVLGDSRWGLMFALVEICRRGQWSFFRVEYQVINVNAAKLLVGDDLETEPVLDDSFIYHSSDDENPMSPDQKDILASTVIIGADASDADEGYKSPVHNKIGSSLDSEYSVSKNAKLRRGVDSDDGVSLQDSR